MAICRGIIALAIQFGASHVALSMHGCFSKSFIGTKRCVLCGEKCNTITFLSSEQCRLYVYARILLIKGFVLYRQRKKVHVRRILPNTQNVCCVFFTAYVTYLAVVTFCIVTFCGINFIFVRLNRCEITRLGTLIICLKIIISYLIGLWITLLY